jgi:membrane associated rhomboid family serine protease
MATLILVIAIGAISVFGFSNQAFLERYGFSAYMADKAKQYDRFFTHAFLHADVNHLILNVIVMVFFAPEVEAVFGFWFGKSLGGPALFIFFMLAAAAASIPDYFKKRHDQNYMSIGASGGVAAIIFSSIVISPMSQICMYGGLCFPGIIWGAGYLAYSYYQDRNDQKSRINHNAHFWGAIFGVVATIMMMLATGHAPFI